MTFHRALPLVLSFLCGSLLKDKQFAVITELLAKKSVNLVSKPVLHSGTLCLFYETVGRERGDFPVSRQKFVVIRRGRQIPGILLRSLKAELGQKNVTDGPDMGQWIHGIIELLFINLEKGGA